MACPRTGKLAELLRDEGLPVLGLPGRSPANPLLLRWMGQRLRDFPPDIVHTHDANAATVGAFYKLLHSGTLLIHSRRVSYPLRRGLRSWKYRIADAVVGLAHAAEGHIYLNGEEITHKSIRERALSGISYIPEDRQERGLEMDFSLAENLGLKSYFEEPFSKKGIMNKEAFDTYGEKLIGEYDIRSGQGIRTIVRSMSGGNQQKAIIAREIERDSSLCIFVQPTRGLDIGAIENIHRQIIAERDKGHAILLISLELDEVMNLADTIGVIYSGELLKIADAKTLTPHEVGEFMMGVKQHG